MEIIQFKKTKLSWPNSGTNKLVKPALILRKQIQFPLPFVLHVVLELSFKLENMLQNKLLFRSILLVTNQRLVVLVDPLSEIFAPYFLLVLHLLCLLQDLINVLRLLILIFVLVD